jgi:predicted transcriptional regulator
MNIQSLTARDLMTPEPRTIAPRASLREAARVLGRERLHCLLVPADPGRAIGVITSKDIVQILCDGQAELLDQLHVADAMTQPALSVQDAMQIPDCLRLMRMCGVRSVPVMHGTAAVGILSYTDVLCAVAGGVDDCVSRGG